MEWRRITAPEHPDFERVFGLYQEGFPLHEQRTREKQEAVLNNPAYFCHSLWDGAGFAGLLMLWEGPASPMWSTLPLSRSAGAAALADGF